MAEDFKPASKIVVGDHVASGQDHGVVSSITHNPNGSIDISYKSEVDGVDRIVDIAHSEDQVTLAG